MLKTQINVFVTPSEIKQRLYSDAIKFRLGGLVRDGSVHFIDSKLLIREFIVVDKNAEIVVNFRGILPSLFKEGKGIIAIGSFQVCGGYRATEILHL